MAFVSCSETNVAKLTAENVSSERKELLTMDSMLSRALREFLAGPHNQLLVNLGGQDGDAWEAELKRFLRKEQCWIDDGKMVRVRIPSILEPVSTVVVPATTARFVAKEKLVIDTDRKAKVKISYLGDNLKAWFLEGEGKIEDPTPGSTLQIHKLREASLDDSIITELGGKAKATTTFAEIFSLMEKQGKGEEGALLNNGLANIFYVLDQNGELCVVLVFWLDDGWGLSADSITSPHRWFDGRQVFSRNSVLEPLESSVSVQA